MISGGRLNQEGITISVAAKLTVNELVYQNKIALNGFLIHLPKVRTRNRNKSITKLEDEGCIGIVPKVSPVTSTSQQYSGSVLT